MHGHERDIHVAHADDRGRARDHTQGNPLLPEPAPAPGPADVQAAMPGLGLHETTMLGYMPLR